MTKKRDESHILTLETSKNLDEISQNTKDIVIDALLEQRKSLKELLKKLDGDLESLGYNE